MKSSETEAETHEAAMRRLAQEDRIQEIALKRRLAYWVFIVITVWLIFVAVVIILLGFHNRFTLSDPVMLAILGASTATLLGLAYIVARHFFRIPPGSTAPSARIDS